MFSFYLVQKRKRVTQWSPLLLLFLLLLHLQSWGGTYCLPVVAGSSTYLSKYNLTSLSLSSGPGRAKFTISSMRSFMAQSNCSGWLLANTSMNLRVRTRLVSSSEDDRDTCEASLSLNDCLLVALFSCAIQESIQGRSEVFTDLLLQKRQNIIY